MSELIDGVYEGDSAFGMINKDLSALLAASFPVKPPSSWFDDPKLKTASPLTITNDGHVLGHIATWKTSHIGMAGSVKAPKSKSNYAFFATGTVECDDGKMVNVGQITLAGGHAPIEASVTDTIAHYDNTDSAVMDVAVGEDAHGIWVAGALRPEVTDTQLRKIRASGVSGDWRPINHSLELVAVCAVNVPGFPIPRARVAGGQIVAMTAAGTAELVELAMAAQTEHDESLVASVSSLSSRLSMVEDFLLNRADTVRRDISDAVSKAKELPGIVAAAETPNVDVLALRASVHPVVPWNDGMDMAMSTQSCLIASLRARVSGDDSAASWDNGLRAAASERRLACSDGSFPIETAEDWEKAVLAAGRAEDRGAALRHIRRRGRTLGIARERIRAVTSA